MPPSKLRTSGLSALGLLVATAAAAQNSSDAPAPNDGLRFVTAALQRDVNDNQSLQSSLSLPFGERWFVQFGGGQTRNEQEDVAHRPAILTGGLGYIAAGWRATVNAAHRQDGRRYRQSDLTISLDWLGQVLDVGMDGSYRDARQSGTVFAPDGQGGTGTVPVLQRVTGPGLGLRGGMKLGEHARLYAGVMRYEYRVKTRQNGAADGSGGLVGGVLGDRGLLARTLSSRQSAVTRDEAVLSRSVHLGATYRLDRLALTAEYIGDRVLDVPGTVDTMLLKAAITTSPSWTVVPALGRTRSSTHGGVNFASLSGSYVW